MTDAVHSTDDGSDRDADLRTEPAAGVVAASAPRSAGHSSIRLSLIIASVVVVIDQLTKHWAVNALSDGESRHVLWSLHWNLAFNSGMAFSRAQGIGPYIGALALVVVIAMVISLRRSKGLGSSVAVGLVVGGAVGNIVDRLFRGDGWLHGSVVDFIDLEFWPIFNVADMGVSIGGVLILLAAVFDGTSRSTT
jgi:signal peptidase II